MAMAPEQVGIGIRRHFTREGQHPYDTVTWERRDARIPNYKSGGDAFFQPDVEFPSTWSQNATNIVAQKYFRGQLGTPGREWSLRQVIDRVADTITTWGLRDGYFVDDAETEAFRDELKYLLLHQRAAFNSPVWFNIGVRGVPAQASACFILAVEDTMASILNWYVEEGTIFKGGSGSGINLSTIRSSLEPLAGGGTASGPVSFMRGADASAGTIKCLHADTDLVTDHGVVPIRRVRAGWDVLTRHGFRTVTAVHDNGERGLVKVRTGLGDEIVCTPEHRFRVKSRAGEAWKEAAELGADDYVIVDLAHTEHGFLQALEAEEESATGEVSPRTLDEAFAVWLGWAHGAGRLRPVSGSGALAVHADDGDPGLRERFRAFTRSVFGTEFAEEMARGVAASPAALVPSRIVRFLRDNGLWRAGGAQLPKVVFSSHSAVRAAFCSGLFESDGQVEGGCPTLWTARRELALDVHRLLLSIGIPSKITALRAQLEGDAPGRMRSNAVIDDDGEADPAGTVPTNGPGLASGQPRWQVRILAGEGVRRFAKLVGFVSEGKARLLEASLQGPDDAFQGNLFVPEAGQDRWDGDELYVSVSVEPAGTGPTFDLTVDDVHEYLVHNVVTHNSGGKTRRAAKMVVLNVDHPDVEQFIWCKAVEERKARALAAAGFDMDLDGADSHSIQYQNANNSVRVSDAFMQAVVDGADWNLKAVLDGSTLKTVPARELLRQICEAAWECADPGMQFDTTINRWHTAPNTGRITASNPCSEYLHLDNSACNLASLNLLKFLEDDGTFDVAGFKAAVEVIFTAQEILVGNADYPTKKIGDTTRRFRQLGIGYANLGALLMAQGLPYDSDEGRAWAAAVTSLMTGHAYATSARTAGRMGPFAGYAKNREPMLGVLRMHRAEVDKVDRELAPAAVLDAARSSWNEAVELGEAYGVRNSQASVLAPTGCLVGGSLVQTARGLVRLRSLGDPDGEQWQPLGVDVLTHEGPRRARDFYVNGLAATAEVVTVNGYRIAGTTTHRIKVVTDTGRWEWKRLSDIRPGDRVPLAVGQLVGERCSVPLPGLPRAVRDQGLAVRVPKAVSPELAELIGYWMGNGARTDEAVRFRVPDADVAGHVERLVKTLFGVDVATEGGVISVGSMRLARWWTACGFAPQPAAWSSGTGDRGPVHVPDVVLETNCPETYRAFLRGLYEAQGGVAGGVPALTLPSVEEAAELQTLLLALGFVTTRKTAAKQGQLIRLAERTAVARWCEEIGFVSGGKARLLQAAAAGRAPGAELIPLRREVVEGLEGLEAAARRSALSEHRRSGGLSRKTAEALAAKTGDAELTRLLGFIYDHVATTRLGEEELTYDLSVPDNVTYVANGFVSHNTIGLMMDCDTTGVEPDLALTKAKKLVGGGTMFIVNQTVPRALRRLGYGEADVDAIVAYIDEHKTIIGAPGLGPEHLATFACAMGDNTIHYMGHVKMMAAVQPFISGAISKCVVGDTLLSTADGLVRISDFHRGEAPDTFRDEVIEVSSLGGTHKTNAFYYGGARPVREIRLRNGHTVTGTPNHRVLVVGRDGLAWRRLDEIGIGEPVALRYGADLWAEMPPQVSGPAGAPKVMTEDLAFLLGAYASCGSTADRSSVRIVTGARPVLDHLAEVWKSTFGLSARVSRPGARQPSVTVTSRNAASCLAAWEAERRIPAAVLASPRPIVLAYLEGLLLGARVNRAGGAVTIALDLPSATLAGDLRAVLANLGLAHRSGAEPDSIEIRGDAARCLVNLAPLWDPAAAASARDLCRIPDALDSDDDFVPGLSPRELYLLVPPAHRARFAYLRDERARHVSRRSLDRVAVLAGTELPEWLDAVVANGLHFSAVEHVADAGEREVYDVSVPLVHAFVANGIVNHNTINMPEEVTVSDVEDLHIEAWRLGLKAIAIYRDNCKVAQPLSTQKKAAAAAPLVEQAERVVETIVLQEPVRRKLPRRRSSKTFSFRVADCHGYVTVGEYDDGRPGEIFLKVAKQGSTLAGIMDAFAISVSHGLQYGVPLKAFADMFINMRFEPAGITDDPDIRLASSLVDYIFRRLAVEYLPYEERVDLGIQTTGERSQPTLPGVEEAVTGPEPSAELNPPEHDQDAGQAPMPAGASPSPTPPPASSSAPPHALGIPDATRTADAPLCYACGMEMQRAGSCYVCSSCGATSGCS